MFFIKSALMMGDKIIVLLEIPFKIDKVDNLYCLNKCGEIVWQSQHLIELYPNERILPYEQMVINNGVIIANDFYGRRYFINPENGSVIKREIGK